MRFKALCFLLSLSLMFCVGFGSSITASAYTGDNNNFYPLLWHNNTNIFLRYRDTSNNNISSRFEPELVTNQNSYYVSFSENGTGIGCIFLYKEDSQIDFNFVPNKYDYYLVLTCKSQSDLNFTPTRVRLRSKPDINSESNLYAFLTDIVSYTHNDQDTSGFTVIGKVPDVSFTSIYGFDIYQANNVGTFATDLSFEGLICAFPKGESNAVGSIISAINNQTSELGGKIDGAADDIQQSIEDQYGGDPGSSFPVDDIITQHNEKMGVLSFGSDTLMQVLGLLSPDQSLSSELVFPSMSLTIAGQRNKVQLWPEYRFDLNELKQHWPDFIGIMQSLTTALVWIFVLRYCYRVFEKYFLAGGGN